MARISFEVPAPSTDTVTNLLGTLGFAGLAVAVGGLTGNWWWTAFVAALVLVLVAAMRTYGGTEKAPDPGPATARGPRGGLPPSLDDIRIVGDRTA